jgi:hypothetical protein
MLSWSDRQSSTVTVSGRCGARTVEWDLPPNMREMGVVTELAYSYHVYINDTKALDSGKRRVGAP